MRRAFRNLLKRLTEPRVLLPLLLSTALLTFLFMISDAASVADRIQGIPVATMATSFGLAVAYLTLKGMQFHLLLRYLRIFVTWRQLIAAFAVGEIILSLPAGVYAQNYVLRQVAGVDFARSSSATTALLASEGGVSMITLAILGIPGWDWLRPTLLAFFAIAAAVLSGLFLAKPLREVVGHAFQIGPLANVERELGELVEGLYSLLKPGIIARTVPLIVAYLLSIVSAFLLVAQAVGVTGITFRQAVTVYLFALTVVLISPISSHLGVIEAGGVSAVAQWGYTPTEGLAAFLGFRLVWTGSIWLACGMTLLALRDEFRTRA